MVDTYVVDSVAISDVMDGVERLRDLVMEARILIPVIVLGEVYFAYENSGRRDENYRRFAQLAENWRRLNVTEHTARFYAQVQLEVKRKGKTMPLNDLWIAALAIQHGYPLLTRDRHFDAIDDLRVVDWTREE